MEIESRFLATPFQDIVKKYILKLEREIADKDDTIRELIIENTKMEVRLESK